MWNCQLCGAEHEEAPTVFGADAPWDLFVPPEEFEARVRLDHSWCVVDDQIFFVRGHIVLPVNDGGEPFVWSVWCSVSEACFQVMMDRWNDSGRVDANPRFGWLYTDLPLYEVGTLELKTMLHEREPGVVPIVVLEPTDHPLAVEQKVGIERRRAHEIAHMLLGH